MKKASAATPLAETLKDYDEVKVDLNKAMGPLNLRYKGEFSAMRFSLHNLTEIVDWLGSSFYAVTCGKPITVEGQTLSNVKLDKDLPVEDRAILLIEDKVRDRLLAVNVNSWVIYNPDFGYSVTSDDHLYDTYENI